MSSVPHLMEATVAANSDREREKLVQALTELAAADSAFHFSIDRESGQIILKGMGELHLDAKVDSLKRNYKVAVYLGAPQVAYRETITRQATTDHVHKKQSGGSGQFARVKIDCEPLEMGKGFAFENMAALDAIPEEYIPSIEKGIRVRAWCWRACRLPGSRSQGNPDRRRLSRHRLLAARI